MAYQADFGSLPIPVPVPSGDATPGDPGLDIFAGYLKATLNFYAGAAWQAIAPGEPLVRNAFTFDPEQVAWSDSKLPALFVFRNGSAKRTEKEAEDVPVAHTNIVVLWVMPPTKHERREKWGPFRNAIAKVIEAVIANNADPAFVVSPGTSTPAALREGTVLTEAAGFFKIFLDSWKPSTLVLGMYDLGPSRVYTALDCRFTVQEQLAPDFDGLSYPAKLDLRIGLRQPGEAITYVTVDATEYLVETGEVDAGRSIFGGGFSAGFSAGFDSPSPPSAFSAGFSFGFQR